MTSTKSFAIYLISDSEAFWLDTEFIDAVSRHQAISYERWDRSYSNIQEAGKQDKVVPLSLGILDLTECRLHLMGLRRLQHLSLSLAMDVMDHLKPLGSIIIVDVKYRIFDVFSGRIKTDKGFIEYKEGHYYLERTKTLVRKFLDVKPDLPYVVGVSKADTENAFPLDQLHDALGIDASIKLLPYDANQPETVKNVIRELLKLRHTDEDSQLLLNLLTEKKDTP